MACGWGKMGSCLGHTQPGVHSSSLAWALALIASRAPRVPSPVQEQKPTWILPPQALPPRASYRDTLSQVLDRPSLCQLKPQAAVSPAPAAIPAFRGLYPHPVGLRLSERPPGSCPPHPPLPALPALPQLFWAPGLALPARAAAPGAASDRLRPGADPGQFLIPRFLLRGFSWPRPRGGPGGEGAGGSCSTASTPAGPPAPRWAAASSRPRGHGNGREEGAGKEWPS